MSQGRIVVITGSPGTGKSTTASLVAKESDMDKSVHMRTDDFYHYLSKGAIPPHLPEANEQNLVVIEAFLEAAKRYARGGYDVIVSTDGTWGNHMQFTSKAIGELGAINGPRCCKRDAMIAFKNGIDYVNAHYGVTLQYEQMQCGFTDFNEQCIKERCPFYE